MAKIQLNESNGVEVPKKMATRDVLRGKWVPLYTFPIDTSLSFSY